MSVPVICAVEHLESSHFVIFSDCARDAAIQAGLPVECIQRIELVMEELVLNVADHGYGDNAGPLTMEIVGDASGISIVLRDHAPPFDPFTLAPPDNTLTVMEREIGGLGVFLSRQMSDAMEYHHEGEENILTVRFEPRGEK